jgi:lysophospholipase L1-like esterase
VKNLLVLAAVIAIGCSSRETPTPPHAVGASLPFAFPIGPASVNGLDAGTYPSLALPACDAGLVWANGGPGTDGGCVSSSVAAGALTNTNPLGQWIDQNSIVLGDINASEIVAQTGYPYGGSSSQFQVQAYYTPTATTDGYIDSAWANPVLSTSALSRSLWFTAPPSTTGITFQATIQLPPGVSASTLTMDVEPAAGGTALGTVTCTETSSWATCTTGNVTVTAGTTYLADFFLNQHSSSGTPAASFLISRFAIVPSTTTNALLSSPFIRVHPTEWWDNALFTLQTQTTASQQGTFRQTSPGARLRFRTNASAIGIQTFNSDATSVADQGAILVNNRAVIPFTGALNKYDFQVFNLPGPAFSPSSTQGYNYVDVIVGAGDTGFGDYVTGVFFPATAFVDVIPPSRPTRTFLYYGDSKCNGYGATFPMVDGLIGQLRRRVPGASWVNDCEDGKTLYTQAYNAAVLSNLIASFVNAHPDVVIIEIGRNDWNGSTTTLAQFYTIFAALLDQVHAALPSAQIVVQTPSLESSTNESTTNTNGNSLSQFRTQMANACQETTPTARVTWCLLVNGNSIPGFNVTTMSTDGTHPNSLGYAYLASYDLQVFAEFTAYGAIPPFSAAHPNLTCANGSACVVGISSTGTDLQLLGTDTSNNWYGGDPGWSSGFVRAGNNLDSIISGGIELTLTGGTGTIQTIDDGTTNVIGSPLSVTGTLGTQNLLDDEKWGAAQTVSSSTSTQVDDYTTLSGSAASLRFKLACRATTAPSGGAIGDAWLDEVVVAYKNVAGTATLIGSLTAETGFPFSSSSMAGTSVSVAVASSNVVQLSVSNVSTATVICQAKHRAFVN